MAFRFSSLLFLFAELVTNAFALPVDLEARQSVSTLSAAEVSAYKPIPVLTDLDFNFEPLRPSLFPGVSSSIRTHDGFGDAHAASANAVLAAVRTGLSTHGTNQVTITGHSLGGAIAIIETVHLAVQIPGVNLRTITYGSPRVGNQAFIDYANGRGVMNRINNKRDPVPILPGRFLNFGHTEGEIHIVDSNAWVSCPGQDNTNSQCTIGYVPSVPGNVADHLGPYDEVYLGLC
ncbi:hypothetical protein EST38_g5907 [Candolleomyces aberdarensis]|uniref:Fungal lipase-type domain-containing protein n=1 Tax=Candolleomyces aberdarensis TaxID=2316362 RepID=A0A4Q2DL10_9AGAR|nr:hypothetical protein EST38_g5907 [Candolleomyces aberdarensis]